MKALNFNGFEYVITRHNRRAVKIYSEDLGPIEQATYFVGPALTKDPRGYKVAITNELHRVTPNGIDQTPQYQSFDEAHDAAIACISRNREILDAAEFGVGNETDSDFENWASQFDQ